MGQLYQNGNKKQLSIKQVINIFKKLYQFRKISIQQQQKLIQRTKSNSKLFYKFKKLISFVILKQQKSLQLQQYSPNSNNQFQIECYQCSLKKVKESFFSITYKCLIDYQLYLDQSNVETQKLKVPESVNQYKNKFTNKPQQVYHIPRILQIIHPNLKYPTYVCIKESPQFFNRNAEVCSECYQEIIQKVTQHTNKMNNQTIKNIKRSISVGNNRSQGAVPYYISQSEQKYPHRIRLASAKQIKLFPQQQQQLQFSPQKVIEDDSECNQPTVFVKAYEKLAMGVHSLSGFQSRNNIENLEQSIMSTATNNFSILNEFSRPKSSISEAQIRKYKNSVQSQQSQESLIKSVGGNSNGFAFKKVYSYYSSVEEGMDVPQISQNLQKNFSQNRETEKISTKQGASETQSVQNEIILLSQEKNEETPQTISVKGVLESQQQQNQQISQQESQNAQQPNIEDITLFNLVKLSEKKDEAYNFLNIQKFPEHINTPTFSINKPVQNATKNDNLNKVDLLQESKQQPYQFRLSFGNSTFGEYQQFQKNRQIQDGSKKETKPSQPSFFQNSKEKDQNEEIIISNEESNPQKDEAEQTQRKSSQSSQSKGSQLDLRKYSQKSENTDTIAEEIQIDSQTISQAQSKKSFKSLSTNKEQKEVNSIQESILTSEAENPELKQTHKQTFFLRNSFTKSQVEQQNSGNKSKNSININSNSNQDNKSNISNNDLPVNMISNSNHIPIKKERGLFNLKKIQSSNKLNQK